MKKLFVLLLVFCAVPLLASNMGFKAQINHAPSAANSYWVSFPYFYTPADFDTSGTVNTPDVCNDTSNVAAIFKWDTTSAALVGFTCGGYDTPFNIVKGVSYQFVGDGASTIQWTSVGSHDPSFSHSYAPTAANSYWVSVPYHWNPSDFDTSGTKNTPDLCNEAGNLAAIFRWDTASAALVGFTCGGYDTPFVISVFDGYQFVGDGASTITWTPSHY